MCGLFAKRYFVLMLKNIKLRLGMMCGSVLGVGRECIERQNLYMFSLYRNPDLDDLIFNCLLTLMAAVQAEDVRASFLLVI